MSPWVAYFAIGLLGAIAGFVGASAMYVHRVWDMKLACQTRVERVHENYAVQRRVYGEVPVEKLIGREG